MTKNRCLIFLLSLLILNLWANIYVGASINTPKSISGRTVSVSYSTPTISEKEESDNETIYVYGNTNINRKPFSDASGPSKKTTKPAHIKLQDPPPAFVTEVMSEEDLISKAKTTLLEYFNLMAVFVYLDYRGPSPIVDFVNILMGMQISDNHEVVEELAMLWGYYLCTNLDSSGTALKHLDEIITMQASVNIIPILLEQCRLLSILNVEDKQNLLEILNRSKCLMFGSKLMQYLFGTDSNNHRRIMKEIPKWIELNPDSTERHIPFSLYYSIYSELKIR